MGIRVISKAIKKARRSRAAKVAITPAARKVRATRASTSRGVDGDRERTQRKCIRVVSRIKGSEIPSIPKEIGRMKDGRREAENESWNPPADRVHDPLTTRESREINVAVPRPTLD